MIKKLKIILSCIFFMLTSFSSYAGESAINTEIGNEITKKAIIPLLIVHKLCSDAQSCWFNDDHVKISAKVGVEFFIYGISDRKLINELVVAITQASNSYSDKLHLSVTVYAHAHAERSFWKSPIAELVIQGEK